jgi:hypothetical protein
MFIQSDRISFNRKARQTAWVWNTTFGADILPFGGEKNFLSNNLTLI